MNTQVRGFTLLELMVVIALGAILLGIGIPNLTEFIRNSRMTSAANDWLSGLYSARAEAIKRRSFVTFCASTAPTVAAPSCAAAGADINGWIVFVDDDEVVNPATLAATNLATDGNAVRDAGEQVLLVGTTPNTIAVAPDSNFVVYELGGFATPAKGGAASARRVVMCDSRGNQGTYGGPDVSAARAIEISVTGRPGVIRSVARIADPAIGGCP